MGEGRREDLIGIIEAAYEFEGDGESWLARMVHAVRPVLDRGFGLNGFVYDIRGREKAQVEDIVVVGSDVPAEVIRHINDETSQDAHQNFHSVPALCSTSQILRHQGTSADLQMMANILPSRICDAIALSALDPSGIGVIFNAYLDERTSISAKESARWDRVVAHIAAGLRLRKSLTDADEDGDAVLAPDGRCLHAEDPVKPASVRESLRRAAQTMDRARGPLRRTDADEAVEIWKGLAAGRWSLVDRFDSDGRRFLVARRNEPGVTDPRALTKRERQVVAYAAMGRSNKLIAYTLGLAESTVATHLSRAMRKLGSRGRVELVGKVAALTTPPAGAESG